ncbi:MAG: DUF3630 family protein [Cognaticolwellia sp.]
MLTKSMIEIIHIEAISSQVLQLRFNLDWRMDNTTVLSEHIVAVLSASVIEIVQGADLYCLRLAFGENEFLLNFEEYSHACWLECATDQDIAALQVIKQALEVK